MVRISRHKTATQGPSLVFLSDTEEKALAAYLKYYRPLAVGCCDPECIVFPNRPSDSQEACCTKMSFSSLSRAISKTARKCKVSHQVTSRILRRSQITALWEKNDDPAWRSKIAEQCCHSLATARRYYEFSSKVEPGRQVVDTLRRLRVGAAEASLTSSLAKPSQIPLKILVKMR